MTRFIVLTAAFAAGLMTFAANAKDISQNLVKDDVASIVKTVKVAGKDPAEKMAEVAPKIAAVKGKIIESEKVVSAAAQAKEARQAYSTIIERYAVLHGISVSLAHAVVRVESNYRPYARGRAGEVGLMQIKPATARMMGYAGSTAGLFDPETNIKYGMKYLAKAQKLGDGTTCGTILKYNAGHAAKRMNPVSLNYCGKVKRHLAGV
jgi:soluble lytic murein transglycosylase-like protein